LDWKGFLEKPIFISKGYFRRSLINVLIPRFILGLLFNLTKIGPWLKKLVKVEP